MQLDELTEKAEHTVSFLGLNEVRLWAQAQQRNIPLREVFLEEVGKK